MDKALDIALPIWYNEKTSGKTRLAGENMTFAAQTGKITTVIVYPGIRRLTLFCLYGIMGESGKRLLALYGNVKKASEFMTWKICLRVMDLTIFCQYGKMIKTGKTK